jgi:hypothetical protein
MNLLNFNFDGETFFIIAICVFAVLAAFTLAYVASSGIKRKSDEPTNGCSDLSEYVTPIFNFITNGEYKTALRSIETRSELRLKVEEFVGDFEKVDHLAGSELTASNGLLMFKDKIIKCLCKRLEKEGIVLIPKDP